MCTISVSFNTYASSKWGKEGKRGSVFYAKLKPEIHSVVSYLGNFSFVKNCSLEQMFDDFVVNIMMVAKSYSGK